MKIFVLFFLYLPIQVECQTSTEKPTISLDFCIGKENGYFLFPGDCNQYLICIDELVFKMACPAALHFSLTEKKCDWRELAGCEYIPTTPKPTEATIPTTSTKGTLPPGTHCDPGICKLPSCRCAGRTIPGNLKVEEIPHMILIGFEDAVKDSNWQIYKRFFDGRKNPNGCPIAATFFVSDKDTIYEDVKDLKAKGHEIAAHSNVDLLDTWKFNPYSEIEGYMAGQRDKIASRLAVPTDQIVGWRTPQRVLSRNVLDVLANDSFMYDNSMQVSKEQRWWPYTLDYPNPDYNPDTTDEMKCPFPPCPKDPYPGLWEVPMNQLETGSRITCPSIDECFSSTFNKIIEGDSNSVKNMLLNNYNEFRSDNKIPFGLYGTAAPFDHVSFVWKQDGFINFIDTILRTMPDAYFVTMKQAIAWMKNPTKLSNITTFQPWRC